MVPRPGFEYDLDEEVQDAVSNGDPKRLIPTDSETDRVPLIVAVVIHDRLDLAGDLFTAGATMTADDLSHVIWWYCDADKARFLLENGVPHNEKCLRAAVGREKWETMFSLLDHGADIQAPLDDYGSKTTLLHVAAWKRQSFVVQRLLQRGAEVDARGGVGMTPLMTVCETIDRSNNVGEDVVHWLLKYGADANATNEFSETPLLLCSANPLGYKGNYGNYPHIGQMLLRHGADPNVASPQGITPLMFAARDNDLGLARALLRAGARTDAKMPDGRTAFDVSIKHGSKDVWALLGQY